MSCSSFSTLGEAWAQLKKSLADEAEVHLKFSSKVNGSFLFQRFLPWVGGLLPLVHVSGGNTQACGTNLEELIN